MSSNPITEEDVSNFLINNGLGRKPKPVPTVPTIRFDLPPLTPEAIAKSVSGNGGPWRSLQDVYRESIEEKRAKRLSDQFDMVTIPEPYFESEDL